MAQEVTTLNNSSFSVVRVDKDISFVLDNRDLAYAPCVPLEKNIGMSRKTYSKKHPITFTPVNLLENNVNGKTDSTPRPRKSILKTTPKCTSVTPSQKAKEIRKRPLDSVTPKTQVPRKIRKREIPSTKVPLPPKINGRISGRLQKSSQSISVSSDPDIEIIQVIEHSTSKRISSYSINGKERNREKLYESYRKRNSKSLPNMIELYPSSDDVPITEADIAPVIPSNSVIPDTSVSETNQGVKKMQNNKWMFSAGGSNISPMQVLKTNGAKESHMKSSNDSGSTESDERESQVNRKPRTGRELKSLYANLNEIMWAREKHFKQMLSSTDHRHSERITAKAVDEGKNLRRLKAGSASTLVQSNKRRVLAKKNSANLALKRAKFGKLKPGLVLGKNLKSKPVIRRGNKIVTKKIVRPNKTLKVNAKKVQPNKVVKQKAASALKPKHQVVSAGKISKVISDSCQNKVGCSSKTGGKLVPSALKKTVKTEHHTQVFSKNLSDGKLVKNFEFSNEVQFLGRSIGDSKVFTTAMKKGSNLRVQVEPLEHTNLWNSDFCEAFSKYVLEQSSAQMEAKNKESIRGMFEELMESWYANQSLNTKLPKKKKPEEEILRSSIRQSEGAFRYKEIVVKKHENYMQFILVPNAVKQNSLSIEAMKELREAFLLAKKDPNCRAVLLNSSGTFFCTGIDLSQLIGSNKKQAAEEMASTIKELVLTLSTFTKPIVAAVNGTAVGFGVTLLTLCDVVLASDKATFSIPATRLGYLPEGAVTLTLPQVVGATVATELLLYGRRLTADQALRHGLVSEVLWHSNLMNEVVPRVQVIVSQPLQVMEATKTMVRCQLWDKLKFHMEREWRLLPPLWLDAQCQNKIKTALQTGWLID